MLKLYTRRTSFDKFPFCILIWDFKKIVNFFCRYCVLRLQFATETLLARYGPEVVNKHADLRRLADVIIDIYAMTACLARSSRSYCIGLQHANYEMILTNAFVQSATERVKVNLSKIIEGPILTNDENYRTIASRLFELKQYYPVHPLTRNF